MILNQLELGPMMSSAPRPPLELNETKFLFAKPCRSQLKMLSGFVGHHQHIPMNRP